MTESEFIWTYLLFFIYSLLAVGIIILVQFYFLRTKKKIIKENILKERKAFERLLNSKEQVLTKLSRELHDEVGARLFNLKLLMQNENPQFFKDCPAHVVQWNQLISDEIEKLSFDVRNLSHEYAPFIDDSNSLEKALLNFITRIQAKNEINCKLHYDVASNSQIQPNIAIELYRIVTELLKNIVVHAKAQHANVDISTNNMTILIKVEDDGIGLQTKDQKKEHGIGLRNINTRVQLAGGSIQFEETANQEGTKVSIQIPNLSK